MEIIDKFRIFATKIKKLEYQSAKIKAIMTKRLLNLHAIQKITLILTTLLLLPCTSWATVDFQTTGAPSVVSETGATKKYNWDISGTSLNWIITSGSTIRGNENGFSVTLNSASSNKSVAINGFTRPTSGSCKIKKIVIDISGSLSDCNITTKIGDSYSFVNNGTTGEFIPGDGEPYEWSDNSSSLGITITYNSTNEAAITINSITVQLTDIEDDSTVFSWPATISGTSVTFNNDKSSLTINARNIQKFSFPLNLSENTAVSQSRTVAYSSSDENIAMVDENGEVTIKKIGSTTITAALKNNDDYYYTSTKTYSYTLDIEFPAPTFAKENGTYSISDNIYFNYQGSTDNMPTIKYKWNDSDDILEYTYLAEPNIKDGTITAWAEVTNETTGFTIKSSEATATYLASYITIGTDNNKTEVTSQNADNISGSGITGNISYNIGKNTLSLNGATIPDRIQVNSGNGLIIEISGTNVTREIVGYGGDNDDLQIIKAGESAASLEATTDRLTGGDSMGPIYHFSSCTLDEGLYLNAFTSKQNNDNIEYEPISGVSFTDGKFQQVTGAGVARVTFCETASTAAPSIWIGHQEVENGKFKNDDGNEILGVSFDASTKTLTLSGANLYDNIISSYSELNILLKDNQSIPTELTTLVKIISTNPDATLSFSSENGGYLSTALGNGGIPWEGFKGNPTFNNKLVFMQFAGTEFIKVLPAPDISYNGENLVITGLTDNIYQNKQLNYYYSISYINGEGNVAKELHEINNPETMQSSVSVPMTAKPCEVRASVEYTDPFGNKTESDEAIGKYFGFKQNPVRRIFDGTNPVDVTPELSPAITDEDLINYTIEPSSELAKINETNQTVTMSSIGYDAIKYNIIGEEKTTVLNTITDDFPLTCKVIAAPIAPKANKVAGDILNTDKIFLSATGITEYSIQYSWDGEEYLEYNIEKGISMNDVKPGAQTLYAYIIAGDVCSDTVSIAYTIKKDIENTSILEYSETTVYTGTTITPSLKIAEEESNETVIDVSNYDVSYTKIINDEPTTVESIKDAGEYQIILTAKGDTYGGKKEIPFTVKQADFASITINEIAEQTYTGEVFTPTITAKLGDVSLASDEYTISYTIGEVAATEINNAGTYTATLTSTGKNFTTTSTKTVSFNITKAIISPTVTLEGWTYGATANEPVITGNTGNGEVTYTYKAAGAEAFATEVPAVVGTHTIKATIAETTNYNGAEVIATFTISAASMTVTAEGYSGTYDGKDHGITVTAPDGAKVMYGTKKDTYDLEASPTYTDAGTYKVYYQVTQDNHNAIADSATVTIDKADITPSVTLEGWTYGATANEPVLTGNTGNGEVTYTYKAAGAEAFATEVPAVVGTHTVKATIAETTNYNGAEAIATFTISAASMTVTAEGYSGTYDGKDHGITVTAPDGAKVMYGTKKDTYDLEASPTYTDAGTYKVYYQVTQDNHNAIADSATVTIDKADITPSVTLEGWTYGATANEPVLTGNTGNGEVTYTYKAAGAEAFATEVPAVVGTHTVKATIAETTNYNGAEVIATFTISAASMTVTAEGYSGTYDGNSHGITVTAPDGAKVMYGTKKGTYNLEASPTYTDAGTYKVYYQVTQDNYNTIADSATVTISKAAGGLTYSAATASAELNGNGWTAPELNNPNNQNVTYTSSNTAVATISEAGVVALTGIGETTIKAASVGDANHEASEAQYVLTVSRGKAKGYGVWIGETEVDEDNKEDVLGDNGTGEGDEKRLAPSFVFNSDDNTLLIIKSEAGLTIESRLPELKIHITGNNKLKAITFNNQSNSENTGTLMFTCDSNKPGVLDIENDEGKNSITGFMSVTFDESSNLCIRNGATTASSIIIGTPLNPLTDNGDGTLNPDDFTTTNPDGTTQTADLTNTNINDILYTLPETTEGQGYNPEDNSISIVTPMSDNDVEKIIAAAKEQTVTVGSSDYAAQYLGITFLISGGKGDIIIDQEAVEGYEFHLKIGDGKPVTLGEGTAGRLKVTIEYEVPDATYCWLYLVQKTAGARGWGNTRVGKRDHAHGHIHSVSIKAKSVSSSNSASKASGGTISVETNAAITGIVEAKTDTERAEQGTDKTDERWYTMDGRRIDKPTQKGLYIRNRKKVVIK